MFHNLLKYSLILGTSFLLAACSNGGSGENQQITSFELIDPTPGASDNFGETVVILGNGNIVVTDPNDSSITTNNGAVHLYNPVTQTLIASLYGDSAGDQLGRSRITPLDNNNFVISSKGDDVGGIVDSGSVRLVDGSTGVQIGSTIAGNEVGERFGAYPGVTALPNNNFVLVAPFDGVGGIKNAGSVRLVNGSTGIQIGTTITGDDASDQLGLNGGITVLGNSNFVLTSPLDDEGAIANAGSIRLIDGSTGTQIGLALFGDTLGDQLGFGTVTALTNNNFVVASIFDDEAGIVDAGSVRLINGSTGIQIGASIVGDVTDDKVGNNGITGLANNNYVIASRLDDVAGIVDAGSVRLVDGSTGIQIGATIAGDVNGDQLSDFRGIRALSNNNFVIGSRFDDEGGIVDAGSVRLINGSTGAQIGATIAGDIANDQLSRGSVVTLDNNNFVVASIFDDEGGIVDAGSVRLIDGSTGTQIGATITGDVANDRIGNSGITELGNNNFVISSSTEDVAGIVGAGTVRIISASTGVQIGTPLVGDNTNDNLSFSNGTDTTALVNNNFVVVSAFDDVGGGSDLGTVRLVDGGTGVQIGSSIIGSAAEDFDTGTSITPSTTGLYYILAAPFADNGGQVDSGLVRLISTSP